MHDNKDVAQSANTNTPNPISNYLAVPGTGEVLAFNSTAGGTFVPIQDGQGSAIGLVNSGNVLQTQFTYDPFGNPTTTGTASQYPYLFKGMEYDATGLYYGGGVYYSPNLGRPLQQVTPGGSGGGQGGINVSTRSFPGSSGPNRLANDAVDNGVSEAAGAAAFGVASSDSLLSSLLAPLITAAGGAGPFGIAVGLAVAAVFEILDLFGFDLFGGGSAPVIPPGYYRPAHYVSSQFIGCSDVTPNMEDSPSSEATVVEVRLIFPNIPEDPTESFHPGEGWESRPNGNWSNPGPPQQGLHPDPGHEYPKGPHYDWNFRRPKRKFSIRNKGGNIQFWDEDLQQWLEALPEEIPPELIIP